MRKILLPIAAAATLVVASVASPQQAHAGKGGAIAAGVIGGLAAGAIIGGAIANSQPRWKNHLRSAAGADAAAFGMLLGLAIGRIGDVINGEHHAVACEGLWGVVYTTPDSPSWHLGATHPATTYEMIGDLLIIGVMLVIYTRFWAHRPGLTFFTGLVLYSAMRFGVSYLRVDSCPTGTDCPEYIVRDWMTFPQVVSVCTFGIGMLGLAWSLLRPPQVAPSETQASSDAQSSRRAATSKA